MSTDYMTPQHPDAFLDHEVLPQPRWGDFKCHKCKGHGGWNLALNQYREVNNDPKTKHFRASCSDCNGWGWTPTEVTHEHVWISEQIGMSLRRETCNLCGKTILIDSSD